MVMREDKDVTIFKITSTAPFPSPSAPSISSITYTGQHNLTEYEGSDLTIRQHNLTHQALGF